MILITGASSGIGEACARVFAADSKTKGLILVARRKPLLEKLAAELSDRYALPVHLEALDVSDKKAVSKFLKARSKLLSEVSVLINNAGLARGVAPIQDTQADDWEQVLDTNVKGLLYLTQGLLPHFIKKNDGHIVNLGSVAGHYVYPKGHVYCASKFAVRALGEALRLDLSGTKIRVTTISPGMVETNFSVVRLGDRTKAEAVYSGMTPLNAQDIAESVHWCARRPKHVNIQDLIIYPTDQASPTVVSRAIPQARQTAKKARPRPRK